MRWCAASLLLLPLLTLGTDMAAHAMSIRELRTLEVREKKDGKVYAEYYLVGVMEGLREASPHKAREGLQGDLLSAAEMILAGDGLPD